MAAGSTGSDAQIPSWLTPKVDAALSIALMFISAVVGGYGLHLMTSTTWQSFPMLLVGLFVWSVACSGLRRLLRNQKRK